MGADAQDLLFAGGLELDAEGRERAADLAARLVAHRASYYRGHPEISDEAYDALEDELRAMDPTHPVLAKVGSGELVSEWDKARHDIPMGSLNKAVSEEELRAWLTRCIEIAEKDGVDGVPGELAVAEKLDGISIELLYEDGKLKDAITRGDGDWGERITANVRRMKGVPPRIADRRTLSVRGEIILRRSDMKEHFAGNASPRNTAAGTSKRFDGQGSEHLTVLLYDVAAELDLPTEASKLEMLRGLGFATPRSYQADDLDEVLRIHERYAKIRDELDYEIDGLVVRISDARAQALLGELNRRPRGAIAFKFASPAKVTRVRHIQWDTGPSGRVTPVAIVAPVELAGATVQRASLHNVARMRTLQIGVGDEVLVSRRNDVIPYVEEVVKSAGQTEEPPTHCSVCKGALIAHGEYLMCRNEGCPALVEGRIQNWISAIGVLEWGDKLIAQLVEAKLVREPRDLYRLQMKDIASLDRRGEKSAKKCLAELTSRLPLTLPVFLAALGIESFALQTARLIVGAGFDSLDSVLAATEEELAAVPGLGAIKARCIVGGLAARAPEIARLREADIEPVSKEDAGPLSGKTFAFTGTQTRPRAELTRLVEGHGGRALSSVTKELNFLVIADTASTSSKAQKARKLGTELITEEQLIAMTQGPPLE